MIISEDNLVTLIDGINETYYNKKEIMYRLKAPLTIDQIWSLVTKSRRKESSEIPLKDQQGNNFWYVKSPNLKENLEIIDREAKGNFFERIDEKIQNRVIIDSLIDEAFNSSVIEGAFSTKKKTKEMIENRVPPSNKSEQMIINNYNALEFILENLDKPLDEKMILDIYNIVVEKTLGSEDTVEKYRNDAVFVWENKSQKPVYEGPHHSVVQGLMDELVEFINDGDELHPVIKACIIHLYFVYIHPFFDGNGRTARALSYMFLLQKGYNFFKFFSISSVVREEKSKYYKAIDDSEKHDSDLTYFLIFYTEMIIHSIARILQDFAHEYKRRAVSLFLNSTNVILPKRQKKLISHLLKYEKNVIDVEEHMKLSKVAYETARSDLNKLSELGLFVKTKQGKKFVYEFVSTSELMTKH